MEHLINTQDKHPAPGLLSIRASNVLCSFELKLPLTLLEENYYKYTHKVWIVLPAHSLFNVLRCPQLREIYFSTKLSMLSAAPQFLESPMALRSHFTASAHSHCTHIFASLTNGGKLGSHWAVSLSCCFVQQASLQRTHGKFNWHI